ncbi:hypothetical protein ABLN67_22165 [Mycobacterium tuberculosis]
MFNRFIYRREWSFRIYRETAFAFFVRHFSTACSPRWIRCPPKDTSRGSTGCWR